MMDGKMSLSKVVSIGSISQLFDAMPFITFATSDCHCCKAAKF